MTWEFLYAPRDRWLVLLAQGWRLSNEFVVGPMEHAGHGHYSILVWRPAG